MRAVYWRFEPADQISACPLLPRAAAFYRIPMLGDRDGRGRGRAAVLRARRRDRHREAAGQRHDPGAERHPEGRAAAGDPGVRHHAPPAAGDGGLAALLGRDPRRDGGNQRLLEAGLLPAGTAGAGPPALPGVAGQGAARAAEERQAGLGSGWPGSPSAGRCPRSCRRRTSGGCAPIPATGAS